MTRMMYGAPPMPPPGDGDDKKDPLAGIRPAFNPNPMETPGTKLRVCALTGADGEIKLKVYADGVLLGEIESKFSISFETTIQKGK